MRTTTTCASATDSPQSESQTPFPHAIAYCPASLERCMYRLLELLQAYWDEFRRPSESDLPPACQRFVSAARASLRGAAAAAQCRQDGWLDDHHIDHLAAQQADRFIEVLDHAIDARKQLKQSDVQPAIDALKLASSLVKEFPWGRLSERTRARDYELLKWFVDKINSSRRGWNDKYWNNLVRQALRAEAELARVCAKGGR